MAECFEIYIDDFLNSQKSYVPREDVCGALFQFPNVFSFNLISYLHAYYNIRKCTFISG